MDFSFSNKINKRLEHEEQKMREASNPSDWLENKRVGSMKVIDSQVLCFTFHLRRAEKEKKFQRHDALDDLLCILNQEIISRWVGRALEEALGTIVSYGKSFLKKECDSMLSSRSKKSLSIWVSNFESFGLLKICEMMSMTSPTNLLLKRNRSFLLHQPTAKQPDERSPNDGSINDVNSSIWKKFSSLVRSLAIRESFLLLDEIDFNYEFRVSC